MKRDLETTVSILFSEDLLRGMNQGVTWPKCSFKKMRPGPGPGEVQDEPGIFCSARRQRNIQEEKGIFQKVGANLKELPMTKSRIIDTTK